MHAKPVPASVPGTALVFRWVACLPRVKLTQADATTGNITARSEVMSDRRRYRPAAGVSRLKQSRPPALHCRAPSCVNCNTEHAFGHSMPHILIVDDDERICKTLSDIAAGEDFTCATANTLRDACLQIGWQQPHAVLVNLTLPDGSCSGHTSWRRPN